MSNLRALDKKKDKRLGRGLDFLLGPSDSGSQTLLLDIEKVHPNKEQPRKDFDREALRELAQSIQKNGLLQAILVEKIGENYQIIAGERRWRACGLAGLKKIPAILKENITKKDSSLWALIENLQREDLNPIEQAQAFKKIMRETGFSQDVLAESLGFARSSLANILRLLNLDPEVQQFVRKKKLSFSQARELLKYKDFKKQREMAQLCLKKSLTVEKLKGSRKKTETPFWLKKTLSQLEQRFSQRLKLSYFKGKGSLSFSFKNEKELKQTIDQLLEK